MAVKKALFFSALAIFSLHHPLAFGYSKASVLEHQIAEFPQKEIFPFKIPRLLGPRSASDAHDWSYSGINGPQSWPYRFAACGGNQQSPIDIAPDMTDKVDTLGPLTFVGYETPLKNYIVENNGHTVVVKRNGDQTTGIEDGGLKAFYSFSQFHFHWGSSNDVGSEHTMDGRRFPIEMHLVHSNEDKTTEGVALTAVLSVLFEVAPENNINLDPIVNTLKKVTFKHEEAELPEIDCLKLFSLLPVDLGHFFRYVGSLTTPPCSEGVVWTIFAEPVPIGIMQLEAFRTLRSTTKEDINPRYMFNNFRQLQKLNGRKILEALPKPQPFM